MKVISFLLDLLYPPRCAFCHDFLETSREGICAHCKTGLPFAQNGGRQHFPFIPVCVSPFNYEGNVRESLLRYKFGGATGYAKVYGRLVAETVRAELPGAFDLITWVPLSRKRLRERGYDPMVYRLFCLGSHYRKALVFSWEGLDNAKVSYDKLVARIAALMRDGATADGGVSPEDANEAERLRAGFRDGMDADLNTSLGITALYDVLKSGAIFSAVMGIAMLPSALVSLVYSEFDTVLSLGLIDAAKRSLEAAEPAGGDEDASILARIEARAAAKREKNYAEADRIRAELLAEGITLIDTKDGTTYTKA